MTCLLSTNFGVLHKWVNVNFIILLDKYYFTI